MQSVDRDAIADVLNDRNPVRAAPAGLVAFHALTVAYLPYLLLATINVWATKTLGVSAQALREDRILDEMTATGDVRRLCDLFGLSIAGAERYRAALDPVALAPEGP